MRFVRIGDVTKEILGRTQDPRRDFARRNLHSVIREDRKRELAHDVGPDRGDAEPDRQERSRSADDFVVRREPAAGNAVPRRGLENLFEIEQWVEPGAVAAEKLDAVPVRDQGRHAASIETPTGWNQPSGLEAH